MKEKIKTTDKINDKIDELIPGFEIFFKKYIGEIMTIIGTGIFTYNIFNFSYSGGYGGKYLGDYPRFESIVKNIGRYEFNYVAYYYDSETLLLIALGAMLIVGGLLIIKNKYK